MDENKEVYDAKEAAFAISFLAAMLPTLLLILFGLAEGLLYTFTGHAFDIGISADRVFVGWLIFTFVPLIVSAFFAPWDEWA